MPASVLLCTWILHDASECSTPYMKLHMHFKIPYTGQYTQDMYMWLFTWVTSGEVTVYVSGASDFALSFCEVRIAWPSLVFCVVFCWSLFALSLLAIVLSVFWLADSDYNISIFNLFILWIIFLKQYQEIKKNIYKSFAKYSICSCFCKVQILSSNWCSWHKCYKYHFIIYLVVNTVVLNIW